MTEPAIELESAVVRFAGDSGDGMQLAGSRFAGAAALAGNDLATFPDFPAEIRAPAGTLGGVSAFQVHFASHDVLTPGDAPDVLVAMNPAALRSNLGELRGGGTVILNTGAFTRKNLEHAGYAEDPRAGDALAGYRLIEVDMNALTLEAVGGHGLTQRAALRCRNFFALGLVFWMFHRDLGQTIAWIERRMADEPDVRDANLRALKTGYFYGETQELAAPGYLVRAAPLAPGRYRQLSGNEALGLGLVTAADRAGLDLMLASYPITPASDILHFLSAQKGYGVRTFQAEDEIAALSAAIGAAYAGALAVTTTSGPGMALKAEALGLAVSLELPLLVVDVQRAGPSTGLPTKVEQSDLLLALFGRSGEAPIPVLAPSSPGDCFWTAIEAARIAVAHMTPVIVLSDAYLANGAEPWRIPQVDDIPLIDVRFAADPQTFEPFARDARLARPWAVPGTPGLEHRVGGLEKAAGSGNVSYDPDNHERMCRLRAEKVARVADGLPPAEVFGDAEGELLVIGWGGTFGAVREAVAQMRERGHRVGHLHLRHLNPFPPGLGRVLEGYPRVLVPELNSGQLAMVLRARFLVDARSYAKLQGKPFKVAEIREAIAAQLGAH